MKEDLRRPISESWEGIPKPPIVTPLTIPLLVKVVGLGSDSPGDWCTRGLRRLIVRLMSFSDNWLLADGDDDRYGDSLVKQPIHSILARSAGLHMRGL
jgi:hypothetical protein